MKIHSVVGGGGVKLHVREWGKADAPPILFIHGWSQNHLCWRKQYESQLADAFHLVAFDLRGHGMSEAPEAQEHYTEPQPWADDIAAIIDQLGLKHPTLVGWSYAGFVICDYVRAYGQDAIAGINFVGAAVTLDRAAFGVLIGPGFLDHVPGATADDFPSNIQAIRAFVHGCTARPLPREDYADRLVLEHRGARKDTGRPCHSRDRFRGRAERTGSTRSNDSGSVRHGDPPGHG